MKLSTVQQKKKRERGGRERRRRRRRDVGERCWLSEGDLFPRKRTGSGIHFMNIKSYARSREEERGGKERKSKSAAANFDVVIKISDPLACI